MKSWKSPRKQHDVEGDMNYYHNLCNYSLEKCEICDNVFSSRFASIIHNSEHIIIPLLKQKVHKCKTCLCCFTSKSKLKTHKENKHLNKKKHDSTQDKKSTNNGSAGNVAEENSNNGTTGNIAEENSDNEYLTPIKLNSTKDDAKQYKIESEHATVNFDDKNFTYSKTIKKSTNEKTSVQNKPSKTTQISKKNSSKKVEHSEIFETAVPNKPSKTTQKSKKNSSKKVEHSEIIETAVPTKPSKTTKKSKKNSSKKVEHSEIIETAVPTKPSKTTQKSKTNSSKKVEHSEIFETAVPTKPSKTTQKSKKNSSKKVEHSEIFETAVPNKPSKTTQKSNKNSSTKVEYSEIFGNSIQNKHPNQSEDYSMYSNKIIIGSKPKRNAKTCSNNGTNDHNGTNGALDVQNNRDVPMPAPPIQQNSYLSFTRNEPTHISIKSEPELSKVINPKFRREVSILSKNDDEELPFVCKSEQKGMEISFDSPVQSNNKSNVKFNDCSIKLTRLRNKIEFEDNDDFDMSLLNKELQSLSYQFQSVHNDELVEPKLSECKRCHMIFGNRMDLYQHEKIHIKIKPLSGKSYYFCNICKRYFSGNHWSKRRHFNTHHPGADMKKQTSNICKICNIADLKLGVNKEMHYKMQHPNLYCDSCDHCFGTEIAMISHSCRAEPSKPKQAIEILHVCDLCFSFTKNTQNFKYEMVGKKHESGKKQTCFYCQKVYFKVKLVRRYNLMMRKQSNKKKDNEHTNEARLAKLQKRFKALKC